MSRRFALLSSCLFLSPFAAAQEFLFTTTLPEQTMSGSGGTSLRFLAPNEIADLQPCAASAEKWAPRTCFHTMAGDDNGNGLWWEPSMFGQIDAITCVFGAAGSGLVNQRTVYWSPSQPLGTAVSGGPGLRPGDVGRIVRNGSGDGQVEYFIRAEQVQIALGLPITPIVVNVDGIASNPNIGVVFSLENDITVNLCTGPTFVRDGDVLLIPGAQIVWSPNMTVQAVAPNSAAVAYTEAQMDAFVANASVTDRFGTCLTQIIDTADFEIDWSAGMSSAMVLCSGLAAPIPNLIFAGESLTGGSILTTAAGGQIHGTPCVRYGTSCGFGPTLGNQIGLRPPSAALGIPSSVNGLASTRAFRFVSEAQTPTLMAGNPVNLDFGSPGAFTWVFFTFAPTAPGSVAPSMAFPPALLGFPDFYPMPTYLGSVGTGSGFGTLTTPAIPWPCKLVFQGFTVTTAGTFEASTPTTVEVF